MSERQLVRPSEAISDSIARLFLEADTLRIFYPESKSTDAGERFNRLVKEYDFRWSRPCWERVVGPELLQDRAAEMARRLLAAGFCVKAPPPVIEAALAEDYEPEAVRLVDREEGGEYDGWFKIWWHIRRGGRLKSAVRHLPGSRWACKQYVVAPPEQFEAVLDFAEVHDCTVTAAARAVAEAARAEKEAALVVSVEMDEAPAMETAVSPNGAPPKLEVPEHVEIDPSLLDD